jgi:hypothetical protein
MRSILLRSFVAATLWVVSPFAQTNTLIVPPEASNQAGNSFANALTGPDGQQVYSAGEFSAAESDILLFTGVSFRVNDNGGTLNAVLPRVTLRMATFPGSMAEARRDPFANLAGSITVYDEGDVHLQAAAAAPGTISPFDVKFTFEQPFTYDRRLGQLVLHIHNSNPTMFPAEVNSMDAIGADFDRGIYFHLTSQDNVAIPQFICSQFSYVVVPEPSVAWIFAVGLGLILRCLRGK